MKSKALIIFAATLLGVAAALYIFPTAGRDTTLVHGLPENVEYITPEEYSVSKKLHKLQSTPKGQRIALLPKQFETGEFTQKPNFDKQEGFVGPHACKSCHEDYYNGFIHTAHFKTSALATPDSILGSFEPGKNVMETSQPGFRFEMTELGGEFSQKLLIDEGGKTYHHSRPFDIVTGSGNIGQTYLYWDGDFLFQLPISWFAAKGWINSPNYTDGMANFARPIRVGCMGCHATSVDFGIQRINLADKNTMILGVTCERCHGPAEKHVSYHQRNPDAEGAKHIMHPNDLPRERMNDVCGQCHIGDSVNVRPPFSFRPGDKASDFKKVLSVVDSGGSVHTANQHPRLLKSRCYTQTDTMNCATCHNPHQNESGNVKLFSQRCMKCHESKDCGQYAISGARIESNCIDCHMPVSDDASVKIETAKQVLFPQIRDHFIRIDKAAAQKVINSWTSRN